jgi:hypothetical protein
VGAIAVTAFFLIIIGWYLTDPVWYRDMTTNKLLSVFTVPLLVLVTTIQVNTQQTKPYGNPVFIDKMQDLFAPYLSNTTSFIDAEGKDYD